MKSIPEDPARETHELNELTSEHSSVLTDKMNATIRTLESRNHDLQDDVNNLQAHIRELEDELHSDAKRQAVAVVMDAQRAQETEAKNRILEKRCSQLTAWAEQHRLTKLSMKVKHEESLKQAAESVLSITQQLETAQAEHSTLKAEHGTLTTEHNTLTAEHNTLKDEHKRKVESTGKRLLELLTSAPADLDLHRKTCTIVQSSSEILSLANTYVCEKKEGSLHICLEEVGKTLARLHLDLTGSMEAARGWMASRDEVLAGIDMKR